MPISRRAFLARGAGVLGALAVGGAVGAAVGAVRDAAPQPFVPPRAPEALSRAVLREQRLLQACAAAQSAHPELADRLAPIVADHTAHLDVLGREWARVTQATAVPGPQPSADPSDGSAGAGAPGPSGSLPPAGTAQDALAALRTQEAAAADAAGADCLASAGEDESARQLAVLLGSISACELVHTGWLA